MIGSGQMSPVQYCVFEGHNKEPLPISDGCGGTVASRLVCSTLDQVVWV